MSSRLGLWLFEPSSRITDVVERRRARLLPKLQLAHAAQMLVGVVAISLTETPEVRRTMPKVLGAACLCVLVCYALSRTRHVRQSVWGYIAVTLATSPVGLLVSAPKSGLLPLMCIIFLLPPVLVANALVSARAALVTGLLALAPMLSVVGLIATPAWSEPVRAGIEFYLTLVVLIVIFGVYRDRIEADRVAELRSRNQELEALRLTLDDQVQARTRELSDRNAAMRLVLDNVSQGILTVSSEGVIAPEHSAMLTRWFGEIEPGETFFRYFARRSATFGEQAELGWAQLCDDILPRDLALEQLPRSIETGERRYRLSYESIESDREGRVLIVVSDVTVEAERARARLDKEETFRVFERVLSDRRGFVEFMHEASELVARLFDARSERKVVSRALHTLKGNAMLFGIQSVAEMCHALESSMALGQAPSGPELGALRARWERLTTDVNTLIGGRRDVIELTFDQHAALQRAVRNCTTREEVADLIDDLALQSMERRLAYLADHARRLAERFHKPVNVVVQHDGVRLDQRPWSRLWPALVHAVRNAVDHGIERSEERRAAGKSELGYIALRARREPTHLVLEVEDDGAGIDWQAIRLRCDTLNLPSATPLELLEGLFSDGVSTAPEVSDISGRGIGMGALRSAVQTLGGELRVMSELGQGTRLRMLFPPASTPSVRSTRLDGHASG